jgi:hypothetical protein
MHGLLPPHVRLLPCRPGAAPPDAAPPDAPALSTVDEGASE